MNLNNNKSSIQVAPKECIQIFHQIFPKRYKINTLAFVGLVAQRLEQRTHNLCLGNRTRHKFNHLRTIRHNNLVCFGAVFRGFGTILGPSFGTKIQSAGPDG